MSLNRKKRIIVLTSIIVILSAIVSFACSPTPSTPALTVPPPPPLPPIERPPPIRVWEGITVETVCLKAELSFPQIEGEIPEPIDDTAREILTRLGLNVVSNDAPYDATLTLSLSGEAFSANYIGAGKCYTGGKVEGHMSLTAEGQVPLTFRIYKTQRTAYSITDILADKRRNPEDFPFIVLWFEPLVGGLAQLWGPQALVWSLDLAGPTWRSAIDIEPTGEVVTALIYALGHESYKLRYKAALLLGAFAFAPEAEKAIPFLVLNLDDENYDAKLASIGALEAFGQKAMSTVPSLIPLLEIIDRDVIDHIQREEVGDALEAITGQDYGEDAALWRQWWDEYQ